MSKILDQMFASIQSEENGLKTNFVIDGQDFWFSKERGMVRLRQVASLLYDAANKDRVGMATGKYSELFEILLKQTFWAPKGEAPIQLDLEQYQEMLIKIEAEDEIIAMAINDEFPWALAVVALGKKVLGRIIVAPQEDSTSPILEEETSEANSKKSKSNHQSGKRSKKHAQGFTPASRETSGSSLK